MSVRGCALPAANVCHFWAPQRATVTDLSRPVPAQHPCANAAAQHGRLAALCASHLISAPFAFSSSATVRCTRLACPVACNHVSCPKIPANPVPASTAPCSLLAASLQPPCSPHDAYTPKPPPINEFFPVNYARRCM
ncbi:hypothetical protein BU23DRAFT_129148 [Bimuria novae-zelandiae CBS 107.79]|uniref:Uncharacterized protein n=1 Tax=Bimuria novae-zelandiae CBS 107.79 TaxID=1447943 RepID=A0A6A5V998_9PLEO|nr:hypothetical protein BU23DRAFT_129148 [Bimuria novae-zelandiae CBS 107.79]